jgi:hypothetical protein
MRCVKNNNIPADIQNHCLKLTAVTMSFQGRKYQGFVMTKDGRTISYEQACAICPPWGMDKYTGCTFSIG